MRSWVRRRCTGIAIILMFFGVGSESSGQRIEETEKVRFVFFPSGLHFSPLKANHQEARVGVFKYLGTSELKVDVGNSIDMLAYEVSSPPVRFTVGIDFMAYAYTTGAQGLRLQVDALDGFFGGNLSFSQTYTSARILGRFRILHQSAHLVDGHYDTAKRQWIRREPIPFTRDFGELTVGHELTRRAGILKYYGGLSYATLVRPIHLKRFAFHAGTELVGSDLIGKILDSPVNLFVAYHSSIDGTPRYAANHQILFGLKLGEWNTKGITLYLSHYRGRSMFSEYYDERVSPTGVGFSADFP